MTPTPEGRALVGDIDTMRDVYLSRAQREAYERITAAALAAMQQSDSGVSELADWLDSTCTVAEITGGPNIRRDEANRKQAAALLRDHAAQLAAKDAEVLRWSFIAQAQQTRADAAMGLLVRALSYVPDADIELSDAIDAIAGGAAEVRP